MLERKTDRPRWMARAWVLPGLPKALPWSQILPGASLAAIVTMGAGLRLFRLGDQSLWLDEAFSVTLSHKPLLEMLRLIVLSDSHPPLYYLLLHFWMALGDSELMLRLLSALLGIASITFMYALGRALYSHSIGLTAALILALSPFHIWYAQEARMYALLSTCVLASAYFQVRALQDNRREHWAGFVIATTLALYSDTGAIWYVAAITIFGLLSWRSPKGSDWPVKRWLVSNAIITLLYLPWLPGFLYQIRRVSVRGFWLPPPSPEAIWDTLAQFTSFNSPIQAIPLMYCAVLLVWGYIVPRRDDRWRDLLTLWIFLPLILSLIVSQIRPVFLARNLMAASLAYYLFLARAVWNLRSPRLAAALLAPLVLMGTISSYHSFFVEKKENWRAVARYVAPRADLDSLLLFVPGYAELPFRYYFDDLGIEASYRGWPRDEFLLHPLSHSSRDLAQATAGFQRVWVIVREEVPDRSPELMGWFDQNGTRLRKRSFGKITLLLYRLGASDSSTRHRGLAEEIELEGPLDRMLTARSPS